MNVFLCLNKDLKTHLKMSVRKEKLKDVDVAEHLVHFPYKHNS